MTVDYWVKKLDLETHPEGGYYKELIARMKKFQQELCLHV